MLDSGISVETMMNEPKSIPAAKAIAEAYEECTKLARAHYENFPVGRLVPKEMQPHVHAVYAFARYADDLADEGYAGSAKAQGARDAMTPAIRFASASNRSCGTTNSTSPMRFASCASIISPERQRYIAMPRPRRRAVRCVPPYPGKSPRFT